MFDLENDEKRARLLKAVQASREAVKRLPYPARKSQPLYLRVVGSLRPKNLATSFCVPIATVQRYA